jgi:hypothetical protein
MPQPKDFKFVLEWKGVEYEFEASPDGWFDYSTKWLRHFTYHGYTRGFTESLRFIKNAAHILRMAYDERGIEAAVNLKVYRLDSRTWKYKLDYVGSLDFTRYIDTELYGEINVATGGTQMLLDAYDKVDYDIPIGTGYSVDVPEGVKLSETATDVIATMEAPDFRYPIHNIPLKSIGNELKTTSFIFNNTEFLNNGDGNPTLEKTDDVETDIRITTKLSPNSDSPIQVYLFNLGLPPENVKYYARLVCVPADGSGNIGWPLVTDILIKTNTKNQQISIDATISISKAGKYYIYGSSIYDDGSGRVDSYGYAYEQGSLLFEFQGTTTPFSFYALPIAEYFRRFSAKLGITQPFASDLLTTGEGKNIFVTSGDAIRGLPNAVIRDKFENLYYGTDSVLSIGMGIDNEGLRVEKLEAFFDRNTEMLRLGEVSKLQIVPATEDFMYNSLELGYEDQTYDEMNGKDEFNTFITFTLPITMYREKMDLISPIRADCYGIQFTRLNLEGKTTTDSSSDNNTFFVVIKQTDSGYEVDRDKEYISGTINPTGVFNIFLSPKRCLMRHAGYLASILQKQDGEIAFTSIAKQSSSLVSRLAGEAENVDERASIDVATLLANTQALFSPHVAKFVTKVPNNLGELLGSNPTGYISFSSMGVELKGFILNVTEKPAQKKEQEWELLLHPDTPSNLLFKLRDKTGKFIRP